MHEALGSISSTAKKINEDRQTGVGFQFQPGSEATQPAEEGIGRQQKAQKGFHFIPEQ
jgi:hypothetical protein